MTAFEWTMVGLTLAGIVLTIGGMIVAVTRAMDGIKEETAEMIAAEGNARDAAVQNLRREMLAITEKQYQDFGETCAALRRFAESVDKEMHQIEIWNRDHYVQKTEYNRLADSIVRDMRAGFDKLDASLTSLRKEFKEDLAGMRN